MIFQLGFRNTSTIHKIILLFCLTQQLNSIGQIPQYTMPSEAALHEGTWLQWPHDYTYGFGASDFEPTWIQMTEALISGENVHIIAYNSSEKTHIENVLASEGIPMDNIDIYIHANDDFWVRDNGPIFVYGQNNQLTISDWGFNGWGGDTPYELCDEIPSLLASDLNIPIINLNEMVLEGGAIEIDGSGSMLATRSSVTGSDRNPSLTEEEIENYMTTYLGITNFIWLEGMNGGAEDITDQHIDGFAKFHGTDTIVTMNSTDLNYWYVSEEDINTLYTATKINGENYHYTYLPLTENNVSTSWGQNLGFRASYVNYYIANSVVLVPNYNDPNDEMANAIIQNLYPNRTVVGIDCRNILANGGMVHCITQQQPIDLSNIGLQEIDKSQKGNFIRIIDLLGRETLRPKENSIYFYIYENGFVKKFINPKH